MKLALQSKAASSMHTSRWRTICRFLSHEWQVVDNAVRLLTTLDTMLFRIVIDDDKQEEQFLFTEGEWRSAQ